MSIATAARRKCGPGHRGRLAFYLRVVQETPTDCRVARGCHLLQSLGLRQARGLSRGPNEGFEPVLGSAEGTSRN